MIELFFLLLSLFSLGVIYGFYDLVYRWLKPKAERMIPKLRHLIPKIPKPKPRTTSPEDIVSDVHERHQLVSRPWGSIKKLPDRSLLARSKYGTISHLDYQARSAVAAQVQQDLRNAENDLFWRQVAEECQKIAGHTDFRSYDPDRGKK